MAGIDKTYTNSYDDYKEFKDWADTQFVTFFDGYKVCIGDWVWHYDKWDFNDGEIPIMNTPNWVDIYLIQNCKSQFVLDRMKSVYKEDSYRRFQIINLSKCPPNDFKQNRKIIIKRSKETKFPLHSKPYGGGKIKWEVECNDDWGYNDTTKRWVNCNCYYPTNTNVSGIRSIKGVIRHLRKQYLPKHITFSLIGKYVGEEYLIVVS